MLGKQHSPALKQEHSRSLLQIFHIALLAVGALMFIASACFSRVWFDEAFTVGAVSNGMWDMIYYLTYDVHPHLYYIVLKLWSILFGNSVIALRMFSVFFGILCSLLGFTHIRKDFGEETGFWFSFLMIFSFSTMKYALQIRMYTFGIFFLTLTGIYLLRYLNNQNKKDRALFLTFSIISAYTHYYAFFIVSMINVFTLVRAIISSERAKEIKKWLFDALIQFGFYSAGLAVFVFQISLGGANWITVEYPEVIYDTVIHLFTGAPLLDDLKKGSEAYNIVGIFLTLVFAETFTILRFRYKNDKNTYNAPFMSMAVCIAVFAFTIAVSFIRPIFFARYSVLFSGFLLFSAAFLLTKVKRKWLKIAVAIVLVIGFLAVAIPFWSENFSDNNKAFSEQIDLKEGDVLVGDFVHYLVCTVEMRENQHIFYNWEYWPVEKTYRLFGEHLSVKTDISELANREGRYWVCGNKSFEFFDNCENAELICEKYTSTDYYNYALHFRLYEIKAK